MVSAKTYNDITGLTLGISIVLMLGISVAGLAKTSDVKRFQYQWTSRNSVHPFEEISGMYSANSKDNAVGSKDAASMKILADKSHALAMCYPVVYDGFLQWAGEDVSPMCNCLQNMHYEYTSHVTNVALWNSQTNDADKAKFRDGFLKRLESQCFGRVRPTQYETLHAEGGPWTTNVFLGVLLWNMLGATCSLFMALSDNDKRQSQDQARTDREKKLAKMQGFSVLVLLQILLIVLTAMTGNASQGSVTCIFSTLYLLLVYLLPFEWDSIRNFVFWVQYAMCLPVVLCVTNMLIQRRDDLTNVVMILIALVISLSAMASDFARIACGKGIPDAASQVFCWTWLSNLVAVTFLLNTSSPLFPRTSFSNAESVVSVVLPAMLLIPILQGVNLKNTSLDEGDTTLLRILIDTFARAVLTVAVACDLFGMSFADNVIIS